MKSFFEVIQEAQEKKVAVGHFNISTVDALWGIFEAAKDLDLPVCIGVSEGERDFIGVEQTVALVQSIRKKYKYPIFLNADHTYSLDRVVEAAKAGFDSIIFDGAKLGMEENIKQTAEAVKAVKEINWKILVEAEVGYIGTSSKMLDELPEDATVSAEAMPSGQEIKDFAAATGIDLISPAVGNIHGMLKNAANPELNIEKIQEIRDIGGVPIVLHGGSGIADDNFTQAIKAGVAMIHINTEIRKAWTEGMTSYIKDNPDEVAPYKILEPAKQGVKQVVADRLKLFNHMS